MLLAKINELENGQIIEKSNKNKSYCLENIFSNDKPIAKLVKKKRKKERRKGGERLKERVGREKGRTTDYNIRMNKYVSMEPTEIKEYLGKCEQLYTNKLTT